MQQQTFFRQFLRRNDVLAGKLMLRPADRHVTFPEHRPAMQAFRQIGSVHQQRQIDLAVQNALAKIVLRGLVQGDHDPGSLAAKRYHDRGQQRRRHGMLEPDPQWRCFPPPERLRLGLRLLNIRERPFQRRQHHRAQFGKLRARSLPVEQGAAQFGLQPLDRAGQRGLRNRAFLRRAGEMQGSGEHGEVSDLIEFHRSLRVAQSRLAACRWTIVLLMTTTHEMDNFGAPYFRSRR